MYFKAKVIFVSACWVAFMQVEGACVIHDWSRAELKLGWLDDVDVKQEANTTTKPKS